MKKWLKLSLWVVFIVLVGIQFVPVQRNEIKLATSSDFIEKYQPPVKIGNMLRSSCYDCHSNQTTYPWYSNIQPFRYLMEKHIREGKDELNLSEFGNQSNRMKRIKFKSILSQIDDDKMPMPSYLFLHSEAKLDSSKKARLVKYFDSLVVDIEKEKFK